MNGYFQLKRSEETLFNASKQLSSLQKIHSAKDDPIGFALSSVMKSDIRQKNQSIRNANDAISLTQVADSAVSNATEILMKVRELAIQSGNSSLSDDHKSQLQEQVTELTKQLSDIGANTTFNGINVFDNSQSLTVQVGFNDSISLELTDISNAENSNELIENIDQVIGQMNNTRSRLGSAQSEFSAAIDNLSAQILQSQRNHAQINNSEAAQSIADFLQAKLSKQASSSTFITTQMSEREFINSLLSP